MLSIPCEEHWRTGRGFAALPSVRILVELDGLAVRPRQRHRQAGDIDLVKRKRSSVSLTRMACRRRSFTVEADRLPHLRDPGHADQAMTAGPAA